MQSLYDRDHRLVWKEYRVKPPYRRATLFGVRISSETAAKFLNAYVIDGRDRLESARIAGISAHQCRKIIKSPSIVAARARADINRFSTSTKIRKYVKARVSGGGE